MIDTEHSWLQSEFADFVIATTPKNLADCGDLPQNEIVIHPTKPTIVVSTLLSPQPLNITCFAIMLQSKQPLKVVASLSKHLQIKKHTTAQSTVYVICYSGALAIELLTAIFEVLAVKSRPVSRYRGTFYYPFDVNGEALLRNDRSKPQSLQTLPLLPTLPVFELNHPALQPQQTALNSQTYLYFAPNVRKALFNLYNDKNQNNAQPTDITEYQLDINDAFIVLAAQAQRPELMGEIERLALFNHPTSKGSFVMAVTIKPAVEPQNGLESLLTDHNDGLWWQLFIQSTGSPELASQLQKLQMCHWMEYSQKVRILYPTFIEQQDEGKAGKVELRLGDHHFVVLENGRTLTPQHPPQAINKADLFPDDISQPVSDNILRLASLFFVDSKGNSTDRCSDIAAQNKLIVKLRHQCMTQHDSRLYTQVCYGLYGEYPKTQQGKEQLDKIFMLARMVDTFADLDWHQDKGYAYNRAFLADLANQQDYQRWRDITSLSGFNEYANVSIGFGRFHNNVIYRHWTCHYHYMLAYSLLNREVLQCFIRAMEEATKPLIGKSINDKPDSEYRVIRRHFIQFMNNDWFDELSHEQQGIELYRHIKTAVKLEQCFTSVKEKIAWADDYMESWRNIHFVEKADTSGKVAVVLAVFAIVTAFPILTGKDDYHIMWRTVAFIGALCGVTIMVKSWPLIQKAKQYYAWQLGLLLAVSIFVASVLSISSLQS